MQVPLLPPKKKEQQGSASKKQERPPLVPVFSTKQEPVAQAPAPTPKTQATPSQTAVDFAENLDIPGLEAEKKPLLKRATSFMNATMLEHPTLGGIYALATGQKATDTEGEEKFKEYLSKKLTSPGGEKFRDVVVGGTSNLPLKAVAGAKTLFGSKSFKENLNNAIADRNDPENPFVRKLAFDIQDSGPQTLIGTAISLIPYVGKPLATAFFGTLSAEEQLQSKGKIESLGNIGIDTVGDQLLGGAVEGLLKTSAKELAEQGFKTTLKEVGKAALVEGSTESSQSLLKYANSFQNAKTEEEQQQIAQETKDYVKKGGIISEFLVGGITGGIIAGAASAIEPFPPVKGIGKEIQDSVKAEIKNDLETKNKEDVVKELIQEIPVLTTEQATALVENVIETTPNLMEKYTPDSSIEDLSPDSLTKGLNDILAGIESNQSEPQGKVSVDSQVQESFDAISKDIPVEMQDEAAQEWEAQHADEMADLVDQQMALEDELQSLVTEEEKATVQEKIDTVIGQQEDIEDKFAVKYTSISDENTKLVSEIMKNHYEANKDKYPDDKIYSEQYQDNIDYPDTPENAKNPKNLKTGDKVLVTPSAREFSANLNNEPYEATILDVNDASNAPAYEGGYSVHLIGDGKKYPTHVQISDIEKVGEYDPTKKVAVSEEDKKTIEKPAKKSTSSRKTAEKEDKSQKDKVADAIKEKPKSIKDISKETGILEPNIRRILGVGAKEGVFSRVEKGVYIVTKNDQDIAYIHNGDAVDTLKDLVNEGVKVDMVFLDIPYDTPAVKGGNRGVKYDLLSVEQFGSVLESVKKLSQTNDTPVIHMYSQAESGMKAMEKYNDVFIQKGFKPVGKGQYQKTFADGSPVTSPNGKVSKPEGILVFTQSGELTKELGDLNFEFIRPKGYQTEKPAEMLKQLIEMTTEEGDTVLDPFAGSGVTGAEAVKAGRKTIAIEKNKEVAETITTPRIENAAKSVTTVQNDEAVPSDMVLYHGTLNTFDEFSLDRAGENTGWNNAKFGIFFLDSETRAREFIEENKGIGEERETQVKAVNLDLKNPIDLTIEGIFNKESQAPLLVKMLAGQDMNEQDALELINEEVDLGTLTEFYEDLYGNIENKKIMQDAGYDGIVSQFGKDEEGNVIKEYVVFDTKQIKNVDKNNTSANIKDDERNDNTPTTNEGGDTGLSNSTNVPISKDPGSSDEIGGEISEYDKATDIVESRNGLGGNESKPIGKKGRQLINEQVVALLESKNFSTNSEDYSEADRDLMVNYTGAGGKESVGAEGYGLLNEYYTPEPVIKNIWNLVQRLVPNAKNAFEPSVGTGRFIAGAPKEIQVDGAEIQQVSGTIASVLYPDSNITIGDFQEFFFNKKTNRKRKDFKTYDVVVGNPPFGDRAGFIKGKGEETTIKREEEYFIKRGLDMTNPGGYLIYVVNSSFLKTGVSSGKKAITSAGGNLVAAYRLPEDSFEDTTIGTDIVVFKKDSSSIVFSGDRDLAIINDNYFKQNPENILGTTELRKNRFGQVESFVKGDLNEAMKELESKLSTVQTNVTDAAEMVQEDVKKPVNKEKTSVTKVTEKAVKEAKPTVKKDSTYQTAPKEDFQALVVPVQNVSEKTLYSPIEISMLSRIQRDGSISYITPEEMPFVNYMTDRSGYEKFFHDGNYFSGEVYKKLDQLDKDKNKIIKEFGQAQYDKQKAGLEAIIPPTIPLSDIIFDPLDRNIANINQNDEDLGYSPNITAKFSNWVRKNSMALSPNVNKYDVIRYAQGERAGQDTKKIMGYIRKDAKRLFNTFIQRELDPTLQKQIEETFNKEKNGYVEPNFSAIPLEIKDMAKDFRGQPFTPSPVQKNGIGFLVNKGSGMIAYGVGVGKTHTLALATVANMQKGWTKRPLFIVPQATITKTWIQTLHEMFPGLVINNLSGLQAPIVRRIEKEKGEDRTAWINDGELTILSHEGILRLGFNEEELRSAAGDIKDALWTEPKTSRAGEKEKGKYDEILGNAQKYVTNTMISDLGFDHISVDEVHNFRKVFQGAKKEEDQKGGAKRFANVVGGTPSKRAQQLFLISQYIQKNNGNRNVFLASATPFENHATEVYNILSFVARDRMSDMGIRNINDFFSAYAEFELELDRSLSGEIIQREKMKAFANIGSLQKLLKEFVDYQIDETLVRPDRKVITPHLPMSSLQEENLARIQALLKGEKYLTEEQFAEEQDMIDTADEVKDEGAFLKASTYSIANSISPYFIKEYAPSTFSKEELIDNSPKIAYAMEALKLFKENPKTKDYGTFLFFGKMGVEHHPMIKDWIVENIGYKPEEVAVLSGKVTEEEKEDIKERFNNGEVKVLIGGDQTKEGIDLQKNGFATINLALGWNPTQITQVEGRVWRQGNNRNIAPLIYPLVENSGDATIYGKFEEKGGRINDLFSYKGTIFDVGEVDPAEKKLALLTNPEDKAKMQIEIDRNQYGNERVVTEGELKEVENILFNIRTAKEDIENYTEQIEKGEYSWGKKLSSTEIKEAKASLKKAEELLSRSNRKLEAKDIQNPVQYIADTQVRLNEIDEKIKEINETYDAKLQLFRDQYDEYAKNRKTMSQHMEQVQGLIDELEERTPEEVAKLKKEKTDKYLAKIATKEMRTSNRDNVIFNRSRAEIQADLNKIFGGNITIPTAIVQEFKNSQKLGEVTAGVITLLEDNGSLSQAVANHEAWHWYKGYLNDTELAQVNALENELLQQNSKKAQELKELGYDDSQIAEELMADEFSIYYRTGKTFSEKVKVFFQKVMQVLNLFFTKRIDVLNYFNNLKPISQEDIDGGNFAENVDAAFLARKKEFEKMPEELAKFAESHDLNLTKKDLSFLSEVFLQSREIYLNDKKSFKKAEEIRKIGEDRVVQKNILDNKFNEIMKPYFELPNSEKERVNEALMEGDKLGKDFIDNELRGKGMNNQQMDAYYAIRKAFNSAHSYLIQRMRELGVPEEEIATFEETRKGYMPHKWQYRYALKTQVFRDEKGEWETDSMETYKTKALAERASKEMRAKVGADANLRFVVDTLDSLEVDFFSEQRFSFENMKSIASKANVDDQIKAEFLSAMRNAIKEKGFGRHFIRRSGVQGYETKDVPTITVDYFTGFSGFITKMEAGKKYFPVLEEIDARKQKNFYRYARNLVAYDMGSQREYNGIKQLAFVYFLANDLSFLLTNSTQNLTMGVGELSKLYTDKVSKIVGPELEIIKALKDWNFGTVTEREKEVIDALVEVGKLGGDLVTELTGFKNNVLYRNLGKGINAMLYNAASYAERNINRVPAFLAARRILLAQGMTEKDANEKALEVSDDIHFRQGKINRPQVARGMAGVVTMYWGYLFRFMSSLYRDAGNKEGISLAKKMFYTFALGGATALPMAKALIAIFKLIFPPDDKEAQEELSKWQIFLQKGLPAAFANIDMSNNVALDLLSITKLLDNPDGKSILEQLGQVKTYVGTVWGLGERGVNGVQILEQGRILEGLGKLLPDAIGNPLKAIAGFTTGVKSKSGTPLTDAEGNEFMYTGYEAAVKAIGYTPTRESLAWDASAKKWDLEARNASKSQKIHAEIKQAIKKGDYTEAQRLQAEAQVKGDLPVGKDYAGSFIQDEIIKDRLETWNTGEKSMAKLHAIEKDIAKRSYGPDYSKTQLTNTAKEFAYRRIFGFDNKKAEMLYKATSNKEKVALLQKYRQDMTPAEFKALYDMGRKPVVYASGRSGNVLISDDVRDMFFAGKGLGYNKRTQTDDLSAFTIKPKVEGVIFDHPTLVRRIKDAIANNVPFLESKAGKELKNLALENYPFTDEAKKNIKRRNEVQLSAADGTTAGQEIPFRNIDYIPGAEQIVNMLDEKNIKIPTTVAHLLFRAHKESGGRAAVNVTNTATNVIAHELFHGIATNEGFDHQSFNEAWSKVDSKYTRAVDQHIKNSGEYNTDDEESMANERFAYLGEIRGVGGLKEIPADLQKYYKSIIK